MPIAPWRRCANCQCFLPCLLYRVGNRVGFRHSASTGRTGKGHGGAPGDIGAQALERGLAKAAEVHQVDIGAQPMREGLIGSLSSTGCAQAHPVGVAPEPTTDW